MPKVLAKVENVTINEGQDAEFTCKFISKPAASKITWFKNESEELTASDSVQITSTEDSSVLKLVNPKSADTGSVYTVKIVNQLGEALSNKATLNVSCGPVFVVEPTDQSVLKDKEAKFECVVKSNPKPNLVWLFNGKEFTNRDGVRMEKDVGKDKYTLVVPKVTPAHIGTITAKATNEFGAAEKSCQLDVLDSPRILNKLDNLTVNEGDSVKFVVKFSGKPKPAIKWFKDEVEIQVDETVEVAETAEDEVSFTIKSSKADNLGTYFAKAVNEFGEVASNKATLTINRAPKFVTKPENVVAIQDQPAKFECLVDAMPKAKLTWLLNGKELTNKDNVKIEADAKTSAATLVIPKVMPTHIGTYTVKASNTVGEVEHTFTFDALETPKVSGKLENVTVSEGQEAKFVVKVSGGKPKPTVKWFKEEEEIVTTVETYEVVEIEDTITLIIKGAKPENAGNYFAQLLNEAGTISTNKAQLIVNRGPVFVKVPEPLAPINKDETVRFECIVEANPKPTVSWLINGRELTTKDGVQIEKDVNNNRYALLIPKANPAVHAGQVTIKASNNIGTSTHELTLSILGK